MRTLTRGLLAAALLAACSDVSAPRTALTPGRDAVRTLGLTNGATADTLVVGEALQLTEALPRRRGKTIATATTWSSSNPAVATVSSQGMVTALATGSTVVTARNSLASESATLLVLAAPTMVPAPAPVPAPTTDPTTTVGTLVHAATGLCLSVAGDRNATGVGAVLSTCAGTAGQQWQGAAAGAPALLTVFAGAQCLDDWGAGGGVGDQLGTWTCIPGAPTQTWTLSAAGELKLANGLCVQGGASAGQQATLQYCTGTAAQRWTRVASDVPASTPTTSPTPAPLPTSPAPTTETTPELPRATVDTRMPAQTGRVIAVPAGGDLQAALDAAQPGDVITLANGATYAGNFVLPSKPAGGWIVV
ncbi:ricin-type beta-trefoil lectin domain protein, partial [Roseisolibacter agri]|uniref:ricin-type beta-trefoil lectin domain protein n=1 Tax=Roseisolibacter agri TaxID=2014610 RepID=UPI0024E07992